MTPPGGRGRLRPPLWAVGVWIAAAVALVAAGLVAAGVWDVSHAGAAGRSSGATDSQSQLSSRLHAFVLDRRVPPHLALIDSRGRSTSLSDYRGKVVVLAPFMTLCSEVCPITTGAFIELQRRLAQAGLASRVVFVEASVDPWRDSPARLHAFSRMTHTTFPLLTGTKAELARIWRFFGVGYRRVPQGKPPAVDWWTHKPLTFDVEHTDALFVIDARGHERLVVPGQAGGMAGHLSRPLMSLLSDTGRVNLTNTRLAGWTVPNAEKDIRYVLAHPRPAGS
jgi:protein SCO1